MECEPIWQANPRPCTGRDILAGADCLPASLLVGHGSGRALYENSQLRSVDGMEHCARAEKWNASNLWAPAMSMGGRRQRRLLCRRRCRSGISIYLWG